MAEIVARDVGGRLFAACDQGDLKTVKSLLEHGKPGSFINEKYDDNESPLFRAAKRGHLEIVRILIQHEADVNSVNGNEGSTPLIAVAEGQKIRQAEIFEFLVEHNANVNFQKLSGQERGWTALMSACKLDHEDLTVIKLLIKHRALVDLEGDIDKKSLSLMSALESYASINEVHKWTALMIACRYGNRIAVELLIKYGANVNKQNREGMSPLMFATIIESRLSSYIVYDYHYAMIMNILLKHGAYVDLRMENGLSALMIASKNGKIEAVKSLLEHGARVNAQSSDGWSALMFVNENEHEEIAEVLQKHGGKTYEQPDDETKKWLKLVIMCENGLTSKTDHLIKQGVNVNITNEDDGWSVLMIVSRNGNAQLAKLLLEYGAYMNLKNKEGWSALMLACQNGWTETAQVLIEHGANVNESCNVTALIVAAQKGHTKTVKYLLEKGAFIDLQNNKGMSALMVAVQNEQVETTKLLLEQGADINMQSNNGMSALLFAYQHRQTEITKLLIDYGADINMQNNDGMSALMIALQKENSEVVELLLNYGADVHVQNYEKTSTLMIACAVKDENISTAKLILDRGIDINLQNKNKWSALMFAVQNGLPNVTKLLLECGADVNALDNEETSPLMVACAVKKENIRITKLILDYGAGINMQNKHAFSALMFAAQNGQSDTAKLLLECGADVNASDNEGTSTLMVAVKNGSIEISQIILDYGADVNMQNKNMWSALMFACQRGHDAKMIKLLLEHGANVNLQKGNHWTALMLMLAGVNANYEMASLLLKYGADINVQGSDGWSALMLACQNGFTEIAHLLIEWGADVNMQNKFSGMTALMIASQDGAIKTVKLLLEYGANVNMEDNNGLTALKLASINRFTEIIKLLAECEAIAAEFSPTVLLIEDLSAETSIEVTRSEQHFSWHEYGLRLHIPENSLPEDVQQCVIHIKASITGDYQLPQDVHLVSAVYSFKCVPKFRFSKPVTLEIQHCAKQESLQDHRLCFVRSPSRADSNFQIFPASLDSQSVNIYFPNHSSYGFVELDSFCRFALVQKRSGKRDYRANIYRHEDDTRHHKIHFTIFWNTNAHNKLVSDYYKKENAVLDNHQMIIFEEKQIKLDIPFPSSVGIATENEWRILTLSPPVITKKEVGTFKKGKRIPSCLLLAKYEGETLSDLAHPVNLTGAGDPYNVFMICISGLVKRIELPGTEAEEPRTMHHQPTSSATGQDRTKFDKLLPSLDDLMILKYTDQGEIKKVRIINDASHKWKDIASIICGDTNKTTVLQQKWPGDPNECLRQIFIENFISKKPQKYSQDWNGLIELLDDVDLEILAKEVRHALSCT